MGQPKALLPFGRNCFVDHLVEVYGAYCDPVIVVLGHEHERIRRGLQSYPQIVVNPDPERGQFSSLQCGLQQVPADRDGFVFTPVDYPGVRRETVGLLVERLQEGHALCAVPRYLGKHGHPVACHACLKEEFLALPADGQARAVVHRHRHNTVYVDVEDPGIVLDVDDPAAYARLLSEVAPA